MYCTNTEAPARKAHSLGQISVINHVDFVKLFSMREQQKKIVLVWWFIGCGYMGDGTEFVRQKHALYHHLSHCRTVNWHGKLSLKNFRRQTKGGIILSPPQKNRPLKISTP
jgi:hypothetical protein